MGARRRDPHSARRQPPERGATRITAFSRSVLRRGLDVVVSSVVLVSTLPVLLLAALAVKLDSPGPVIYRHARVGRDGTPFELFRLRSTVHDPVAQPPCAGDTLSVVAERGATVTRVGRILRGASIDELPQLWNVLRGDMALIGPPPDDPSRSSSGGSDSIRLLPGLTGTWRDVDGSDVDQEAGGRTDPSGSLERGGPDSRAG